MNTEPQYIASLDYHASDLLCINSFGIYIQYSFQRYLQLSRTKPHKTAAGIW